MELRYLYGEKASEAQKSGTKIHEILENETHVPIVLETKSYADYVYKILYTNCAALEEFGKNGKTRELNVFGRIDGFDIGGKVDELDIKDDGVTIIEDKTRGKDDPPTEAQMMPNKVQVMFYRQLLGDLAEGAYKSEDFSKAFGTPRLVISQEFERQLDALGVDVGIRSVLSVQERFFSMLGGIGNVSDSLYLRYRNQFTHQIIKVHRFDYERTELEGAKQYLFKYWRGEREAMPVPEAENWKCKMCVFFGDRCKVWWTGGGSK